MIYNLAFISIYASPNTTDSSMKNPVLYTLVHTFVCLMYTIQSMLCIYNTFIIHQLLHIQ